MLMWALLCAFGCVWCQPSCLGWSVILNHLTSPTLTERLTPSLTWCKMPDSHELCQHFQQNDFLRSAVFRATQTGDKLHANRRRWIWIILIIIVWSLCLLTIPGNHPKDSGHSQSPFYVVFWPASEQQPFQRAGSLASPWNGSFPCEGEIRTGTSHRGVEVRENQRTCYVHLRRRALVMGTQFIAMF